MASIGDTSNMKKATEAAMRWIELAAGEAVEIKKSAAASAVAAARAGASQLLVAASSAIEESKGLMELVKSQYAVHEDLAVAKIKEAILVVALHPEVSCGVAAGVGLVIFKRPRRFLVRNTRCLFMSEEERARKAEEMERGQALMKGLEFKVKCELPMASKKMRLVRTFSVLILIIECGIVEHSLPEVFIFLRLHLFKTLIRYSGLKEIIKELPRRDASRFRSEVSTLVSQVKQDKKVLARSATKIINYGIAI